MAVRTGTIKRIEVEDGQLKAYCDTGHGQCFTATIPQIGGDFRPLEGDSVTATKMGAEWIAFSVVCGNSVSGSGEHMLFARDSSGNVVSTIHAKADGTVEIKADGTVEIKPTTTCSIGDGRDFVAMSAKLDRFLTAISLAVAPSGSAVVTPTPGAPCPVAAAILAASMLAFNSQSIDTSSINLKADV